METVPLRACCAKCLTACSFETHWLPPLKESSREQSPVRGRTKGAAAEEDWCAGLHFTKGALRLRRSASQEQSSHTSREGSALLGTLVLVDEVDLKRSSTSSSPRVSLSEWKSTPGNEGGGAPRICTRALDRVKGLSKDSGSGSGSSSPSDDSEEDLFPLPSPKRSPAASPADSSMYLPGLATNSGATPLSLAEPRKLEAAIRAKIAEREQEVEKERALRKSPPVPIPITKPNSGRSFSSPSPRMSPSVPKISHDTSQLPRA